MGTNALAPVFYPNLGYDPEKDFEPVGLIAEQPELLAVRKDIPANNLKEFAAYAKANEGKLNMGHAGVGSVSYIGCLLLNNAIGIKPTMVPFTGTAPVMNAILAGNIDYDCDPVLGTAAACARRHRQGAGDRRQEAQPAAAGRADVLRAGLPAIRLRAVLRGVRAERHAEGDHRQARRRARARASTSPPCKSGCSDLGARSPSRTAADRKRWPNWCTAKSRG